MYCNAIHHIEYTTPFSNSAKRNNIQLDPFGNHTMSIITDSMCTFSNKGIFKHIKPRPAIYKHSDINIASSTTNTPAVNMVE